MSIFEKSRQSSAYIDPTHPLSVSIENTQIVNGHTEYLMKVQCGWSSQNTSWQVTKRYNDFARLDKEYKMNNVKLTLPPKKYFGNMNQKFVAERQIALQEYLHSILSDPLLALTAPIRQFLDTPHSSGNIHNFEDTALQHISMILGSDNQYQIDKKLSNIGWRNRKQYYTVNKKNENSKLKKEYLLSWIQYGGDRIISDKDMNHVNKMLLSIQHPFIEKIELFHSTHLGCIKVQNLEPNGSLRDTLCSSQYKENYLKKYFGCDNDSKIKLERNKIIRYSLEILNTLKFLHKNGLYCGHLHCGNLVVNNNSIHLLDIENMFIGVSSQIRPWLIQHKNLCNSMENIDVYCYGLLLYEMCTGEQLTSSYCDFIPEFIDIDIRMVLESLLSTKSLNSSLPTVNMLLNLPIFQGYVTMETLNNKPSVKISCKMKEYLPMLYKTVLYRLDQDHTQVRHAKRLQRVEKLLNSDELDVDTKCIILQKRSSKKSSRKNSINNNNVSSPNGAVHTNVTSPDVDNFDSRSNSTINSVENVTLSSSSNHIPSLSSPPPPQFDLLVQSKVNLPSSIEGTDSSRTALLASIQNFNKNQLRRRNC